MIAELLERLRLVTQLDDGMDIKEFALKQQERQQLREEVWAAKAMKQDELEQLDLAEAELDFTDALCDGLGENEGGTDGL